MAVNPLLSFAVFHDNDARHIRRNLLDLLASRVILIFEKIILNHNAFDGQIGRQTSGNSLKLLLGLLLGFLHFLCDLWKWYVESQS